MKKLEGIIRAFEIDSLKDALAECGVRVVIATDVTCTGASIQQKIVYRGSASITDSAAGTKLEIAVPEERFERVLSVLSPAVERGPAPELGILVHECDHVPVRHVQSPTLPGTLERVEPTREHSEPVRHPVAAAVEWVKDAVRGPSPTPSF